MGSVVMKDGIAFRFDGYNITLFTNCVYCDNCGSFHIVKRKVPKKLVMIPIIAIFTLLTYELKFYDLKSIALMIILATALILISILLNIPLKGYRCKKCGHVFITHENIRNYPEYDKSILDMPYEFTLTFTTIDY